MGSFVSLVFLSKENVVVPVSAWPGLPPPLLSLLKGTTKLNKQMLPWLYICFLKRLMPFESIPEKAQFLKETRLFESTVLMWKFLLSWWKRIFFWGNGQDSGGAHWDTVGSGFILLWDYPLFLGPRVSLLVTAHFLWSWRPWAHWRVLGHWTSY